jgi:thiosulfate/3-mercaptopyruvate sulfurtransferase
MTEKYLTEVEELQSLLKTGSEHSRGSPGKTPGQCGLENVFVIDTRDEVAYRENHIPGAVNVHDIFTYLCTRYLGGYEALVSHFVRVFGDVGLKREDKVVVYEDAMDNGYGQSCRGWFILKYLGHPDVTVLHGGYRAWLGKGMPTSRENSRRERTKYGVALDPSMLVTADEMLEAINDPSIIIIDVRDYAEWIGANSSPYGYDYCPRKGRIPRAKWLEWYRLMARKGGTPWFRSKEDILKVVAQVGITPDSKVYVYCFKGARTSNALLAMRWAGIKNVRNYFASWNEWSRDFSLPIEEGYPESQDDA